MAEQARAAGDRFQDVSVLVVEDETVSRALTVGLLKALGITRIVELSNAPAALERLGGGLRVDLVITDIHMPKMSGLSFLDAVRGGTPGIDPLLPMVIVTGLDNRTLVEKACQRGCDGYIVKPPAIADLAAAIIRVLDAGRTAA